MRSVHIIGVPLDLGGGRRGVDMGPSAFRIAGLGDRLTDLGLSVADYGDLPAPIRETQDQREKAAVRDSRVHVFTMKDIDRQGIASTVEQAVKLAGQGTAGIHVSFDLDACDPAIAPGVGTPVRGGFNYREAHMIMEIVADSGLLTSLDMVEVNPTLDLRNTTAELATELVLSALGMKIL